MMLDGKALASAWLSDIAVQVRHACRQAGALEEPLHLAAVCACPNKWRVGDDAGLKKFVTLKQKAAHSVGIHFSSYFFDMNNEAGVRQTLEYLAGDETVHGIFVEMPLPGDWSVDEILALIPPGKDVDALTGRSRVPAPAVRALDYALQEHGINVHGVSVAMVGHGRLIGQPIERWLLEQGANVSVVDINTKNPETITAGADIVVCGVGKAGLITADWIKEGATVIDFGYSKGKGDVDAESVQKKAGLLSPVPGGMGPLVVAAVLENLVSLSTS